MWRRSSRGRNRIAAPVCSPDCQTLPRLRGHATDTHLGLATITADRQHLDQVELVPFRAAIAKGVDSVMTAHISVPALNTGEVPSTLSPEILTKLLRDEMHFQGLTVTDALDMGAIVKAFGPADASVKALEAGADVLLMPPDPEVAVNAIVAAVRRGRISAKAAGPECVASARRQDEVGARSWPPGGSRGDRCGGHLPRSQRESAQEVADRAVTLLRNDTQIPLRQPLEDLLRGASGELHYSNEGLEFTRRRSHKRTPDALVLTLDPSLPDAALDVAATRVGFCDATVVAAFVSVAARANTALSPEFAKLVDTLIALGKPVTLIALGNPYLLRAFPKVAAYLTTYSTVAPSEISAVKALFGEMPIRGRLPVTIPDLAKYGDGIQLPATAAAPATPK